MNTDAEGRLYQEGWRLRRDGGKCPHNSAGARGWHEADHAIKCGRQIGWSAGTDGLPATLPERIDLVPESSPQT